MQPSLRYTLLPIHSRGALCLSALVLGVAPASPTRGTTSISGPPGCDGASRRRSRFPAPTAPTVQSTAVEISAGPRHSCPWACGVNPVRFRPSQPSGRTRVWSGRAGSNRRPPGPKTEALRPQTFVRVRSRHSYHSSYMRACPSPCGTVRRRWITATERPTSPGQTPERRPPSSRLAVQNEHVRPGVFSAS